MHRNPRTKTSSDELSASRKASRRANRQGSTNARSAPATPATHPNTRSCHKRGFYSIITTFFFIMIALAVVIGLIYYLSVVTNMKRLVHSEEDALLNAKLARDAIFSCYGTIIHEENLTTQTCKDGSNLTLPPNLLVAWSIQKLPYHACNVTRWESTNITALKGSWKDVYVYAVPVVQQDALTCPGQLELYLP